MAYTERYVTSTGAGLHDGTSEANAWSLTEAVAAAVGGQRINIKSDATYTLGANLVLPNGTSENPIGWRGYSSTIGDLVTLGRTAPTSALNVTGYPVIDGGASYSVTTGTYNNLSNIKFTGSLNGNSVIGGTYSTAWRCLFENTHATGAAVVALAQSTSYSSARDCDVIISSSHASAIGLNTQRGSTIGCYIKNTNGSGGTACVLDLGGSASQSIMQGFTNGVRCDGSSNLAVRNSIYNVTTGINLNGTQGADVANNIIYGATYGIGGTTGGNVLLVNNAMGNLATGRIDTGNLGSIIEEISAVVLTGDPFTNAASDDFSLNNTSGAGALCRAASLSWGGFEDIGAVQHEDAGGGGLFINSRRNILIGR